jgi:hypothetical protein
MFLGCAPGAANYILPSSVSFNLRLTRSTQLVYEAAHTNIHYEPKRQKHE